MTSDPIGGLLRFVPAQKRLKSFFLKPEFTPLLNDFVCPEEASVGFENPFVNLEYCHSFCKGEGCIRIPICQAYQNFKKIQTLRELNNGVDKN